MRGHAHIIARMVEALTPPHPTTQLDEYWTSLLEQFIAKAQTLYVHWHRGCLMYSFDQMNNLVIKDISASTSHSANSSRPSGQGLMAGIKSGTKMWFVRMLAYLGSGAETGG